jgi:hypothetical protein
MPKLKSNWRDVLRYAWSVRFIALAAILSGVEIILPLFVDSFPRGIFAALCLVTTAAAFVARIVAQTNVRG